MYNERKELNDKVVVVLLPGIGGDSSAAQLSTESQESLSKVSHKTSLELRILRMSSPVSTICVRWFNFSSTSRQSIRVFCMYSRVNSLAASGFYVIAEHFHALSHSAANLN